MPDPTAEQGKLYQIPGLPPDVAHLKPAVRLRRVVRRSQRFVIASFRRSFSLTADHHSLCHFAREVYAESGGSDRFNE